MTFVKAAILLLIATFISFSLVACGGGGIPQTVNPLVITTRSLPTGVVNTSYSATLAVTGGLAPYTWSITSGSLPSGLSMSAQGVISGTPTANGSFAITVQVTDSQKPTAAIATSGYTLTINNPLSITTTKLDPASVNIPYVATLTASGGVPLYKWSVLSGSLPDGLTLSSAGVISGTPTKEQVSTFTVQVTDSESPAVTANQDLTLTVGGAVAKLSGNNVFVFRGFSKGSMILEAGSFVSDGAGTITSGNVDIVTNNGAGASHVAVPVHGTYTINSAGQGTMSLFFGNGSQGTYQIASSTTGSTTYFSFIQNGDGQSTTAGSGVIKKQGSIPTDLAVFGSSTGSPWVFGGYGANGSNQRYAAAGTFKVTYNSGDPSAAIGGLIDVNDNGTVSIGKTVSGTMTLPDATNGRGTLSFGTGSSTGSFAYYYIGLSNGSIELAAIETDPVGIGANPMILYSMRKQVSLTNGYTNKALQGTTISELSAVPSANNPDVSLGLLDFDGNGTGYATIDENNAGTVTQSKFTATYNVDSTGRVTITGWNNVNPLMYLWSFESGFILGQDAAVTYGDLEFQNVQSSSHNPSNADFTGAYSGGTVGPAVVSQTVETDTFTADGATPGKLTGTYDISGGGNQPQQGLPFNATYNVDTSCPAIGTASSTTCGRFPLMDSNNNQIGIGYLVNIFTINRVVIMKTNTSQPVIDILQK